MDNIDKSQVQSAEPIRALCDRSYHGVRVTYIEVSVTSVRIPTGCGPTRGDEGYLTTRVKNIEISGLPVTQSGTGPGRGGAGYTHGRGSAQRVPSYKRYQETTVIV
ncbi:hypothetical protein J6590_051719 [Homalodisca vitripennis]|nr:hypothetical protein J6590_051719 [Homalodisca vitripennis]